MIGFTNLGLSTDIVANELNVTYLSTITSSQQTVVEPVTRALLQTLAVNV